MKNEYFLNVVASLTVNKTVKAQLLKLRYRDFKRAVRHANKEVFTALKGVGEKTAQRIIDVISQVVGVSELVSAFLHVLAEHFAHVTVVDVSGNHSRIEQNAEHALRAERLDALIPWYCKAKLEKVKNVSFCSNQIDPTIAAIDLFGKTYVAVHGDFDPDLKTSAQRISHMLGRKVDYFLAGHMHVADMRIEDVGYFRNGAVVSGGDEYTVKKRLFGPAVQVCLLVSPSGVDAVYPVRL